ncbi:unnamed protein product [Arabidopsis halleri]
MLMDSKVYLVSINLHRIDNDKAAPSAKSDNRLVVWNMCSGETRWIQPRNSYKKSDSYALGYDNRSSCYKILRMDRFAGDIFQTE